MPRHLKCARCAPVHDAWQLRLGWVLVGAGAAFRRFPSALTPSRLCGGDLLCCSIPPTRPSLKRLVRCGLCNVVRWHAENSGSEARSNGPLKSFPAPINFESRDTYSTAFGSRRMPRCTVMKPPSTPTSRAFPRCLTS